MSSDAARELTAFDGINSNLEPSRTQSKTEMSGQEEMARSIASLSFQVAPATTEGERKLSTLGLFLNMTLSIIGTTVLGISAQMPKAGWILTPLLLCMGCCIVSEMTWVVSNVIAKLRDSEVEIAAYQDLAHGAFGFPGRMISSVTSTMALVGLTCNGLVLISKNLDYSLTLCNGGRCGRKWWALAATPTTLFYAFVDAGDLLQKAAVLGPVVCVGCVVLAWFGEISAITELSDFPQSCRSSPDLPYWTIFPDLSTSKGWMNVADVASYGFYCFAVVVTVPSLQAQMQDPSKLVPAATVAYALCTGLFITIMMLGYCAFGNLGPQSIIDGMTNTRPIGWWALNRPWETGYGTANGQVFSWMITLNLLLTDAIYVPCTVQAMEGWAPSVFKSERRWTLPKVTLRLAYAAFRTLVATEVEQFVELTNLTSSLFCICNNILIPILAFHKIRASQVGSVRKAMHFAIFLFGIFVVVIGSTSALKALLSPNPNRAQPGTSVRKGISAECEKAYKDTQN